MKQEKKMILDKYKTYEKKIKDQRAQITELKATVQKQEQFGVEERGEKFVSTINKLTNSEK